MNDLNHENLNLKYIRTKYICMKFRTFQDKQTLCRFDGEGKCTFIRSYKSNFAIFRLRKVNRYEKSLFTTVPP